MNRIWAQHTVKCYVCACCWGHLEEVLVEGEHVVRCAKGGDECDGKGFVTKFYADRRRQESMGEAREVRTLLREFGVIENPLAGKSEEQLLKELGF